jgi:hypothetical protein
MMTSNRPSEPRDTRRRAVRLVGCVLGIWLVAANPARAQDRLLTRLPVLTRHSGVVRMQSWRKGFLLNGWVDPAHKTAYVGTGDWIQLSGSGSQGDIVLPDLTTVLMRRAAEIQIVRVAPRGGEHVIRILNGLSLDISLTETTTRLLLPDGRAVRGRRADVLIKFQPYLDRIRVRHIRGQPLQVFKDGRPVRSLDFGQVLDLRLDPEEPFTPGDHDLERRFVFRARGRRVEISPGVAYELSGDRIRFRREGSRAATFGIIRIGDEVVVVGPGSMVEVRLPPPDD